DNRRPVDYGLRKKFLEEIAAFPERVDRDKLQPLMDNFPDGKIKMYTLYRALKERKENPDVFAKGTYVPLGISSDFSSKVAGFARYLNDHWYLTIFPVAVGLLAESGGFPLGRTIWADGYLELPEIAPRDWVNVYTGQTYTSNGTLGLSDLFSEFPVALLKVHRL
ncbi:MAG TPA: hypothetical protein VKZ51_00405, partial [Cyclobacteriaceae bacterium]|nr:hypothetical protein [Cyclobacteriaceae bacterium]